MRAREAATWEMEERQLHEKHQLAKRQLKDMFFLQRHQMLVSQFWVTRVQKIGLFWSVHIMSAKVKGLELELRWLRDTQISKLGFSSQTATKSCVIETGRKV